MEYIREIRLLNEKLIGMYDIRFDMIIQKYKMSMIKWSITYGHKVEVVSNDIDNLVARTQILEHKIHRLLNPECNKCKC